MVRELLPLSSCVSHSLCPVAASFLDLPCIRIQRLMMYTALSHNTNPIPCPSLVHLRGCSPSSPAARSKAIPACC
ncbi:hypothetical protein L227DRAFT_106045 [Lentinus tigrinus ALCF2SS1-6]|uniref:Uncharacterized protein n=1 Tax=Lentinus tigrinus ALCF2SS1-6 TaxID=1328759 RepID=A0A5C2SAB8_9APHY|nr:hypothetical protein L227DRAFT_106045 [Lentinus tigrinus ALCF2SS1-6]